jgi:hypothetical protein
MPTPETAELLKRAEQLRLELAESDDPEGDAALADALDTLRRLSRRPSLAAENARFEDAVAKAVQSLPGVVAGRRARRGQPDLVVQFGDRTMVVEAKARLLSRGDMRRGLEQLRHLREAFGADHGFLVVQTPAAAIADTDDHVSVVTVSELLDKILEASNMNEGSNE